MEMKMILAILLGALGLYMFMRREGFDAYPNKYPPCPADHIAAGPKYIHTASGDCKLSTHVHDSR